ncbi:MAG: hypothetical protein E7054_09355 [Lentisphaerae bacterium]|nr:hypothetical protein [Lentisphaerota bacterium]
MVTQSLEPQRSIFFAGETVKFTLSGIPADSPGRAIVRTNIGRAALHYTELIDRTEKNRTPRNADWHDVEMEFEPAENRFTLTLPLPEVGTFEAKCCFIPQNGSAPLWPGTPNFKIKVEPAFNVSGNTIYCAFVRQWGNIMHLPHSPALPDLSRYDAENFTVVPPSGTFRKLAANLDHIFSTLNCRILQLLPIHPVPVSYGRMGRYGSPFAATDYFAVDPALAEFDEHATPMEQFGELIDAVHLRKGRIFMDIPVNHTGWASKLQCEHPDYFVRNDDKKFENPGAWGIVWADLCRLDYSKTKVHELMAKVFLFWCKRGIDGFRCDAGYMVPSQAWDYIVSKVRKEYPDTVFLLEGLGGPLTTQEHLLSKSGLNWGYSELFQNYSRDEISRYYPYMNDTGNRMGTLVNFAETHDNDRLAAKGKTFAKLRFLVTALLSQHGAFGFANGAEFYAAEKIDVHGCGALNFGDPDNLTRLIGKLNTLLAVHPAFGVDAEVKLIQRGNTDTIAAWRSGKNTPPLLILLNLDCNKYNEVSFPPVEMSEGTDLLTSEKIKFDSRDGNCFLLLAPGEGRCISFDDFTLPQNIPVHTLPETVCRQYASALAQNMALHFVSLPQAAKADGSLMRNDPLQFVSEIAQQDPPPLTVFRYPEDCRRVVMLPPGDLLLIKSKFAFTADLKDGKNTLIHAVSLPVSSGEYEFIFFAPPENTTAFEHSFELDFTAFTGQKTERASAQIVMLPDGSKRNLKLTARHHSSARHTVFGANDQGGYAMFSAAPGKLHSKYDAILAANINKDYPVDRHVMFTDFRAWLVIDEYSQELSEATLEEYTAHPANRAQMRFTLPDGHGGTTGVDLDFAFDAHADRSFLRFTLRDKKHNAVNARLIIRPDLEDRVNHTVTRACDGAEHLFRHSIKVLENGFDFQPAERKLALRISKGKFFHVPEWRYMVDLPFERYYGLPDKTDLFSPGYFSVQLSPGEAVTLSAAAGEAGSDPEFQVNEELFAQLPVTVHPSALALPALSRFIVKRDDLGTVIAGYPWFLDWGRDTLIVLRGLVKYPQFHAGTAQILRRFAAFERNGTIPNMICGNNDSNRDTSDAPLYFIIAVRDYIRASKDKEFLNTDCGGRPLKAVIDSIISNCKRGTSNGIVMDEKSKLLFSPSHFSWMDTAHPAGTPRQGYPIEIQSLWYAALKFVQDDETAKEVSESIEKYFFSGEKVSDCLHCTAFVPPEDADPDDHTRCNMLTAITLQAVKTPALQRRILDKAGLLLVPGAIRTLDDDQTAYQLPVIHNDTLLNDPAHPYQGHYCGPEDSCRKVAYHNGTAWCWPFPSYCEALYISGGEASRSRALSLLMSAAPLFENGITGQLPEVLDGDAPHTPGGCPAQAWSVSEFFRVLDILEKK